MPLKKLVCVIPESNPFGDVILSCFYRSKDRKSVQCMGMVGDALSSENIDEVFPAISKRTVHDHSDTENSEGGRRR